jgi:flagellar hook-length control protein FliK
MSTSNLAPSAALAGAVSGQSGAPQGAPTSGDNAGSQSGGNQQGTANGQTDAATQLATNSVSAAEQSAATFSVASAAADAASASAPTAAAGAASLSADSAQTLTAASSQTHTSAASTIGFSAALSTASSQEVAASDSPQPVRQPQLATPLDQVKVQIESGAKGDGDTITVQLRPEELGRVEIKLEVQDGQVKATVTADRPETLQLLKNEAPSLQQSLSNAGLEANAGSLSFQLRSDQQRQANQGGGRQDRRARGIDGDGNQTAGTPSLQPSSGLRATSAAGGVDISV